ncbi:hypothetical protein FKW77_005495 [Venturia effusa]|uniref:Uncharacterized protein n=1 Tax=Venturia effusa TaxID=50376 RepID=A0A517LMU8_9PEZI|nr:hypothetical protein FKW77_005495 [Venturia effusa]
MSYTNSTNLKVKPGSGSVPQSAVFDLKTRTMKKKVNDTTLSDQIPRLWIRQIPSFILAYHDRGCFKAEEVTIHNIKSDIAKWEDDNKQDVRKFIALIKMISDFVKMTAEKKIEVRYREGTGLGLRKQGAGVAPVLPDVLTAQWAGQRDPDVDEEIEDDSDSGRMRIDDGDNGDFGLDDDLRDWDSNSEKDFTACSAEECGYCGHCSY